MRDIVLFQTYIDTLNVVSKLITVTWQKPSPWIEPIFIRMSFQHTIEGFAKLILPDNDSHTREVIDSLICSKPKKSLCSLGCITPIDIKFFRISLILDLCRLDIVFLQSHPEVIFCYFPHNIVFAICYINVKPLLL